MANVYNEEMMHGFQFNFFLHPNKLVFELFTLWAF